LPDIHLGGPGSTPAWGNKQKKKTKNHLVCLKNDLMSQGAFKKCSKNPFHRVNLIEKPPHQLFFKIAVPF